MLRPRNFIILQKRWKKKLHWAELRKKTFTKDRALANFDDFYGSVYSHQWGSMRAALLTEHKYIALVNNFADAEKTKNTLELSGAINVRTLTELANNQWFGKQPVKENHKKNENFNQKLTSIIQKAEDKELASLYPENAEISEEKRSGIFSNNVVEKRECDNQDPTIYKKALEIALEQNSEIDHRRIIDSEYGTAALHEFISATKIKGMEDWIPESDHYKYYSTNTDFPLSIEVEKAFSFYENVDFYTYEKGNCSEFISPQRDLTGVLSHFLMDGASILPPLFLNVQPGEKVLDACAAPGGKSLIMLQTMRPDILVCNDIQESRLNRIRRIMDQYVCDYSKRWSGKRCFLLQSDARAIDEYNSFDRILVDVPCTTDRHSVMENDNNIFKSTRIKERLRLPELQAAILSNCLRLLKPRGTLVYSTCTLSPVQNDGVVHMALQKAFTDHKITTTVKDLSFVIKYFNEIFKFEDSKNLRYGQMVVPFLPANFGPMYICKITRNE